MQQRLERNRELTLDNILFATDFSPASEAALAYAVTIADHYHSMLYVAHVINSEPFDLISDEASAAAVRQAHLQASERIDRLLKAWHLPDGRSQTIVAEGSVAEVLIDAIQQNHIGLVVLGTHGRRAFKKLLLGSIAEEVFRRAPCPVMTVGPKIKSVPTAVELKHILYPLEFVPDASETVKYAISLAEQYGAHLTVMHAQENTPSAAVRQERIAEPVEHWFEDHIPKDSDLRRRVRFEIGFGSAAETILNCATKTAADLIVMSVNRVDPVIAGHLPKPDTGYEVVSRAPCPVLTIAQ